MSDGPAPPHNIQAEQSIIGSIISDNNTLGVIADLGLSSIDFFDPLHAAVFEEIIRKTSLGEAVSVVTLSASFPTMQAGGMSISAYLESCRNMPVTYVEAIEHAKIIKQFSTHRAIVSVARALENNPFPPDESLAAAWSKIDAIRMGVMGRRKHRISGTIEEATQETLDYITQVRSGSVLGGIKTGLSLFDNLTGGLQRGELVVFGGRPGIGKSLLAVSMSRQIAKNGVGVGIFSLEMPEKDIGRRMLADHAYDLDWRNPIAYTDVFKPGMDQRTHQRLVEAQREIRSLPTELDFSSNLTVAEIGAKVRWMAGKIPLGVIVIDYLKFVRATKTYRGQRVYEIGEITAALKGLAKDLNICVILLVQLNRETEKRDEKRPRLSDVRESGDIEADADVVGLLYRESYYLLQEGLDKGAEMSMKIAAAQNIFEIYVAKQRMGPTGWLKFHCCMASSSVRDLDFHGNAPTHEEFR